MEQKKLLTSKKTKYMKHKLRDFVEEYYTEYHHDDDNKITVCVLYATLNFDKLTQFTPWDVIVRSFKNYGITYGYNKYGLSYSYGEITMKAKTTCSEKDVYNKERGEYISRVKAIRMLYSTLKNIISFCAEEAEKRVNYLKDSKKCKKKKKKREKIYIKSL